MGPRAHQAARGLSAALSLLPLACASARPQPVAQAVAVCPMREQRASMHEQHASMHGPMHPDAAPVAPSAPEAAPRPIDPVLPTLRVDGLRFRDRAECARGVCTVEGLSPLAPDGVASDDGATTMPPALAWVHVIQPGAAVVIPRHAAVDLLGVVLTGDALLRRVEAPAAAPERAAPWTAFLLPEGGAQVRADRGAPVAVLFVTAAETPGQAGPVVASGEARARGGYALRDLVSHEDLAWAGGSMHARIAFEAPASPRASLGLLIASDNARVPEHSHAGQWETLAVLSAAGRLHVPAQTVEGTQLAVTERDRTVTAGTIAYVPASVRHGWVPDGTHPLIAVQVYSPPGPEQRFRALAAAQASPTTPR